MIADLVTVVVTSLHLIAAIIWVGGIFLVYKIFRPVALEQAPPIRLKLFYGIFERFFRWVWWLILVLLVTGYLDWFVRFGGFDYAPLYMHLMHWIGWLMVGLFALLYFIYYRQFQSFIMSESYPEAGKVLNTKMRPIIVINLMLGFLEAVIGVSGLYW